MRAFMRPMPATLLAMLLSTAGLAGCAALVVGAAAGVGAIVYVNGELDTVVEATMDGAWKATNAAIDDLEFTATDSRKDALSAEHTSRTAQGKKVHIRLNHETDSTTRIRIRVDVFGNEELSRTILDKIKARL